LCVPISNSTSRAIGQARPEASTGL
jgi:hypothetical protein